jgi:chitin disaccharide deacetylase
LVEAAKMGGLKDKFKKILLKRFRELLVGSLQKRLGYPANTKLLIIHADDLGLTVTQNQASIEAIEKGVVNSGSIMVPCRGYSEIIKYASVNRGKDFGVHLTLTSEWESYKWGPVLTQQEVKSLTGADGFFLPDKRGMIQKSSTEDIEKELSAQINQLLDDGVDITHLDSHMFVALAPKVLKIYTRLGKEYKIPVLLTNDIPVKYLLAPSIIAVDKLLYARNSDFKNGFTDLYSNMLKSLTPGLNCILVHVAYDNKEMKEMTGNNLSFGSAWRQADFDFFTGAEARRLLKENNIKLITWSEIHDKLVRKTVLK